MIFPLIGATPTVPSPNTNSYLDLSEACTKKIFDVEVYPSNDVAWINSLFVVSVEEFWMFILILEVSTFGLLIINLWLLIAVLTKNDSET